MKFISTCLFSLTLLMAGSAGAQGVCRQARDLLDKLNSAHLYPLNLDDSLSADLFDEYFHALDPGGEIFTLASIKELERFRFRLDDEIISGKCDFVTSAKSMYIKRIERLRAFADSILQKPLRFKANDVAPALSQPNLEFSPTEKELREKLAMSYQLSILSNMYEKARSVGKDPAETSSHEPASRALARQSIVRSLDRKLSNKDVLERFAEQVFLKSLPRIFDPHSEFFSEEEMRAFEESINPEVMSFGLELEDTRLGEVKVTRLAPGGPAWNSSQIHEGDFLVSLEFGSAETYDVQEMDAVGVTELLNSPEKPTANMTFRTADGLSRKVSLQKSKIENKENLVSGLVLRGKHTFGYVSLPSFYTTNKSENVNGCANDVAKEILKLKSEKIEGLILDLRFNGGGSTREALDLAGIFIDVGPLAVIEMKGQPPFTLKDMNRGLAYDGPLIIMVSKASASASELVAAALQDHNRAVIVGSSSFGKATGQIIIAASNDLKPSYLKVTHERLFRITGASLQQTGIRVDYELPNLMEALVPGEITLRHSMLPLTTNKKTIYQPYAQWKPAVTSDRVQASLERVKNSAGFTTVSAFTTKLREPIPLEPGPFFTFFEKVEELSAGISKDTGSPDAYKVSNTKANEQLYTVDRYHQELNLKHRSEIESSIYVQEVCHILEDLLKKP